MVNRWLVGYLLPTCYVLDEVMVNKGTKVVEVFKVVGACLGHGMGQRICRQQTLTALLFVDLHLRKGRSPRTTTYALWRCLEPSTTTVVAAVASLY